MNKRNKKIVVDCDIVRIIFSGKPIFKNLLLRDAPVIYKTRYLKPADTGYA
jgi:hypothetical protein